MRALNEIAARRGQTLAQLALAWMLRDARVTSALIGASSVEQLEANVAALDKLDFTADELEEIDRYATEADINLWARSPLARNCASAVREDVVDGRAEADGERARQHRGVAEARHLDARGIRQPAGRAGR